MGSTGWRLPWQMRVAVAEQLTLGLFDPDGNHLRPEAPALQDLLVQHVWPVLGISRHDEKALFAWAHFCQAVWGGPVALLQAARGTLQELHQGRPLAQGELPATKGLFRTWGSSMALVCVSVYVGVLNKTDETTWIASVVWLNGGGLKFVASFLLNSTMRVGTCVPVIGEGESFQTHIIGNGEELLK